MLLTELPCYVDGFYDSRNLRDLGGWRAAAGRRVARGHIFRSGRLSDLSPREHVRLNELGLRTIVDLRSSAERANMPDEVVMGAQMLHVDARRRAAGAGLPAHASLEDLVHEKAIATAEMAFGSQALRTVFALLLAKGRTPLLIHCNSGKDRTGVVAMIVLMALGASDETILEDYLLSNAYRHAEVAWSHTRIPDFDKLPTVYQELYDAFQGVIPLIGHQVLATIDARYPTREQYLWTECGLDQEALTALRTRYLTD